MFLIEFYKDYKAMSSKKKRWFKDALLDRLGIYITLLILIGIVEFIIWYFVGARWLQKGVK